MCSPYSQAQQATPFIDEVFVKINGKQHYLWRAVDHDGGVVDEYLQAKRDGTTAKRFFKRLLRSYGGEPRKIVTDKLRSYGTAVGNLFNLGRHLVSANQFRNLGVGAFAEWSRAVA